MVRSDPNKCRTMNNEYTSIIHYSLFYDILYRWRETICNSFYNKYNR